MSKAIYQHEPNMANKKVLQDLVELIGQYNNVGITKVENIASKTIQRLRHDLRGDAVLRIAKNTLMILAIKEPMNIGELELMERIQSCMLQWDYVFCQRSRN